MFFYIFSLFTLFSLFNVKAENLRGTVRNYIEHEREKMKEDIIQSYVDIYGYSIYENVIMNMEHTKSYSFYEFGCMPFTEDMKNTEIIISKDKEPIYPIFTDNGIDYSFKVYSCYSHFVALKLFKRERERENDKNNYIPKNEKYNYFKFYYYEDLEMYGIHKETIQERINEYLMDIFDDMTHSYENCCRIYTIHW
jgi:hypothetical protein